MLVHLTFDSFCTSYSIYIEELHR